MAIIPPATLARYGEMTIDMNDHLFDWLNRREVRGKRKAGEPAPKMASGIFGDIAVLRGFFGGGGAGYRTAGARHHPAGARRGVAEAEGGPHQGRAAAAAISASETENCACSRKRAAASGVEALGYW